MTDETSKSNLLKDGLPTPKPPTGHEVENFNCGDPDCPECGEHEDNDGAVNYTDGMLDVPDSPTTDRSPQGAELKTPAEWAQQTGNVIEIKKEMSVGGKGGETHQYPSPFHAAATALHGWKEHQHHENKPIRLTRADYEAAIEAAKAPPKGERSYRPHGPALSPHAPYAKRKG